MIAILLSHAHADHIGGLAALRAATGAPAWGFAGVVRDLAFAPDRVLADGNTVGELTALHTPGHAADHLCFARADGVVFTGDHVMGWSTSVVCPPGGDMAAYVGSLQRLLERDDRLYLPGHGPAVEQPRAHIEALLHHRREREQAIAASLVARAKAVHEVVQSIYVPLDPRLQHMAERNVLAHLRKLEDEGRVVRAGALWRAAAV